MKTIELKVTAENFAEDHSGNNSYECNVFGSKINIFRSVDDEWAFQSEVPRLIAQGSVFVYLEELNFGLQKASKCIRDGGRGDEDGYGVEPDTWMVAYLNSDLKFVSPFALEDSSINRNIANFLEAGIYPFEDDGTVKIDPFYKVERDYRIPDCFKVLKDNNWGFANSKFEIIIPPAYKIIHGDRNGMVCFRQHNDLCGLLNLQNELVIPDIYDYLSFIDEDEFWGCYRARLNGKTGIIDRHNKIIKEII